MNWQPIETAPRPNSELNGPRILGWCPAWNEAFIVKWSPGRPFPHWTFDSGAVSNLELTHWMPLPDMPELSERKEGV